MSQRFIDALDRPIAFHRVFKTLTKSTNAALMLSQGVYWEKRTTNPDGWFWKTQDEWENETGLTRYEQEGAREVLGAIKDKDGNKIFEEKLAGLPARMHFRVNLDALDSAIKFGELTHTGVQKTSKQVGGKTTNIKRNTKTTTKNTSKTTTKNTSKITTVRHGALPHAAQTNSDFLFQDFDTENNDQNETAQQEAETPLPKPSSSTPTTQKSSGKKSPPKPKPEPPEDLKLESFAEQTLLQMLTKYKDAKKLRTPTHWQNQNQKDLFTDGAQRLTNAELIECVNYWLAKNVHGLGDLSAKVKQWADRRHQFEVVQTVLQSNGNRNGKTRPFSGFDAMKLLENGEW